MTAADRICAQFRAGHGGSVIDLPAGSPSLANATRKTVERYFAARAGCTARPGRPVPCDLVAPATHAARPRTGQGSLFDMYVKAGANAVKKLPRPLAGFGEPVTVDGVPGPMTAAAGARALKGPLSAGRHARPHIARQASRAVFSIPGLQRAWPDDPDRAFRRPLERIGRHAFTHRGGSLAEVRHTCGIDGRSTGTVCCVPWGSVRNSVYLSRFMRFETLKPGVP